jgi:TetR/AcrR family transcriptional regulator
MDNRSHILAVALKAFARKGYDGVGVQEIAVGAGITKPTLYHYYGNKEGLLTAIGEKYFYPFLEKLKAATQMEASLEEALQTAMDCYFRFASSHRDFYRLLLGMMFAPPESKAYEVMAQFAAHPFVLFTALFARFHQHDPRDPKRSDRYAATFIGIVNNYIALFLHGQVQLTATLRDSLVHDFLLGIHH